MTIETIFPSHILQYSTSIHCTTLHCNASHCTRQDNTTLCNLPNTDYRIALHRTAPRHTTPPPTALPVTLLHGALHSASSPLNMHLLAPTLALAPTPILALGLLLTPVIRTSCSLHNGTRSILSFSFLFLLRYHTMPYHTIPYHTIPLIALHSNGPLLLYSTLLEWNGPACLALVWFKSWTWFIWFGLVWLYYLGLDFVCDD